MKLRRRRCRRRLASSEKERPYVSAKRVESKEAKSINILPFLALLNINYIERTGRCLY